MFSEPSENFFEHKTFVTKRKITLKSKFTINNFSLRQNSFFESPEFSSRYPGLNDTWCLDIWPDFSSSAADDRHLNVYIIFISAKENEQLPTRCKLSIITSKNEDSHTFIEEHTFSPEKNTFGRSLFVVRDELLKSREKYLPNDSLTISCEIEINVDAIPSQNNKNQEAFKMKGNDPKKLAEKTDPDFFKYEINTTDKKITLRTKFIIKNFCSRREDVIVSPVFTSKNLILNETWHLEINPNLFTPNGYYMAVYLRLLSTKAQKVHAKCQLAILNSENRYSCNYSRADDFKENSKLGRDNFMLCADLFKLKGKYLPDGNLTIICVIDIDPSTNDLIIPNIQQSLPTPPIKNPVSQLKKDPEVDAKNSKTIPQDPKKDVFEYETGLSGSANKITLNAKFIIRNFSLRQEVLIASPEFSSNYPGLNDTWGLDIHPNIQTKSGHHLGVNLICLSAKNNEKLSTKCKLSIITRENVDACTCAGVWKFTKEKNVFGRDNFMVRGCLFKSKERYLPDDNLTISCLIELDTAGPIDKKFSPNFRRSLHSPQIPIGREMKASTPEMNNSSNNDVEKTKKKDIFKGKTKFVDKNLVFTSRWTIKNFSTRKEIEILSTKFSYFPKSRDVKDVWRLMINPSSLQPDNNHYVGVHLMFLSIKTGEKIPTQCKFSIITSDDKESCSFTEPHVFTTEKKMFGRDDFIQVQDLLKLKDKYLPGDNLTISCEIIIAADEIDSKKIVPKVEQVFDSPEHQQVQQIDAPQQQQALQSVNNYHQQVANVPHYQVSCTLYDHYEYDYHHDYEMNDMFAQLLISRQSSDAMIIVGTRAFPVIKGILASRSVYFSALFKSPEYEKNENNEIHLKDIKTEVFAEVLQFIYSDRSPNIDKMALDLLGASDKYGLKKLKDMSEDVLLSQAMTFDNAPLLFYKADVYNAEKLRDKTLCFIAKNLKDILRTDTLKSLKERYDHLFMEIVEKAAAMIHEYLSDGDLHHQLN